MPDIEFVKYRTESYLGWMTLNRPPVNALGKQLVSDIAAAAQFAQEDITQKKIRVLILNAEGKHFCAGADLKERQGIPESEVENVVQGIRNAVEAIYQLTVPTIAAIQGTAAGGGMELALAADMRILAESAKLGLRETALAIIPGAGGTQRMVRLIGYARAMEWIATASMFDAQQCLSHGVANLVVPDDALAENALRLASLIASNGPIAVQAAKEAMRRGMNVPLSEGMTIEMECYRRTITTADRREALRAFNEKRAPEFRGN